MLSALDDEEESAEEESREHSETASDNNTKDDSDEAGDSNMRQPEFDEEKTEDSVKKLSGLRSGTGSLMGVMSEVFGLPEAGSAEAAAAAKAEEDKFEIWFKFKNVKNRWMFPSVFFVQINAKEKNIQHIVSEKKSNVAEAAGKGEKYGKK